jgi:hypothetical protein
MWHLLSNGSCATSNLCVLMGNAKDEGWVDTSHYIICKLRGALQIVCLVYKFGAQFGAQMA